MATTIAEIKPTKLFHVVEPQYFILTMIINTTKDQTKATTIVKSQINYSCLETQRLQKILL